MQNKIIRFFVMLSIFTIYIVKSCTPIYTGDARCDARCKSQSC
jgi:hypothetical protein